MKRDMELVRKIVLAIEDSPTGYAPQGLRFDGYTPDQIGYHAYLMIQAGLAEGVDVTSTSSTSPESILTKLTWAGHEFADAAGDEPRWKKAMGIVKEKSGTVTIAILTQLLTGLMKGALGLS